MIMFFTKTRNNTYYKWRLAFLIIGVFLFASGCTRPRKDTLFQVSTIDALLAGVYDGNTSCRDLLAHGNFGLGTFNRLDGEMVVFRGKIYQIKTDGKAYTPPLSAKTPFATVCRFNADKEFPLPAGTTYPELKNLLEKYAPNPNLFYAIKITGLFRTIKTRSVPAQKKPYPPLAEVVRHQVVFNLHNVYGTIVGFRCPAYIKGINVAGYHLHFISRDRTQGGHVLSFELAEGKCAINTLNRYLLILPRKIKAFAETDLSEDRTQALKTVEEKTADKP